MENKTEESFNKESSPEKIKKLFKIACVDYKDVTAFDYLKHLAERTNEPIYLYAYYLQTDLESLKQSGILELIENKSIELSGGPETDGARLKINQQFTIEKLLDFWKQHSEVLKPIRELDFYGCKLVEVDIQILARSLYMQNITGLDLGENNIGMEGVQALANSENLGNLTELDLEANGIGTEGARVLANSENLRNLTKLVLGYYNYIKTEGAQALANSENLRNLTELDLEANGIGTEGARALANSENLGNLTKLVLSWNDIGMEGVQALANSENLGNLTELNLKGNMIETKILEQLRQEHPNIQFIF